VSDDERNLDKPFLLLIALLQGIALLLLNKAGAFHSWLHGKPQWSIALYTLAIAGPVLLLLSHDRHNRRVITVLVGAFTLVVALLGYYLGTQSRPRGDAGLEASIVIFILTIGIAGFMALMYIQQYIGGGRISYSSLYHYSWRNFVTLGLALLFALVFWGILALWGTLFKIIHIDFFSSLFKQDWFLYPALALANGLGIIIFRKLYGVIDTITRLQQALMQFLLPVLVLIAVLFLLSLPFTGTAPLWETGSGSLIILWLQALMLFFVNGVYQDDPGARPYPLFMHRFVYLAVALLLIYSIISCYGLYLRVEQYGWSIDRCWAVLIWAMLALFILGYLWGIVSRRDQWITTLDTVNIFMGLAVLFLMLLVNTPLLDFRKITLASQLARLESGSVQADAFDYGYIYSTLARPGYEALQRLSEAFAATQPDLARVITARLSGQYVPGVSIQAFEEKLTLWPDERKVPRGLLEKLYGTLPVHTGRNGMNRQYYLFRTDLNADNVDEYIFLSASEQHGFADLYYRAGENWLSAGMRTFGSWNYEHIIESIAKGNVHQESPRWQNFQIGDITFRPSYLQ
jgi:Domain of unknown function (DUF4153)